MTILIYIKDIVHPKMIFFFRKLTCPQDSGHPRKEYYGLWTHILDENTIMMDLLLTSFCLLQTLIDGLEWCGLLVYYCDVLSAVWTLILTAPIHCRASIAETLMQRHISPNLMKKQTHLDLG